jgi:hypothetical protein
MAECVPAVWKWREEERAAQQREEDGEGKEVREEGSGTQKIRRLMVATLCAGLDLKIGEEAAPQPNPGPRRRRQDSEGEDAFRAGSRRRARRAKNGGEGKEGRHHKISSPAAVNFSTDGPEDWRGGGTPTPNPTHGAGQKAAKEEMHSGRKDGRKRCKDSR